MGTHKVRVKKPAAQMPAAAPTPQPRDLTLQDLDTRLTTLETLLGRQSDVDETAPLWMQNVAYPAQKDRQLIRGIWPQEGIVDGFQVTPRGQGANMSVDVAPGQAVVAGADAPHQGSYLFTYEDVTNLPLAAAPGAGTSRRDLIVLQTSDDAVIGDLGRPRGRLAVLTGVATATPQLPAVPSSSLVLAEVGIIVYNTAQITAAMITDRRGFSAPGAITRLPIQEITGPAWSVRIPQTGILPSGFQNLEIRYSLVSCNGAGNSQIFGIFCNEDRNARYLYTWMSGWTTGAAAGGTGGNAQTFARVGAIPAAASPGLGGAFGKIEIDLYDRVCRHAMRCWCSRQDVDQLAGIEFDNAVYGHNARIDYVHIFPGGGQLTSGVVMPYLYK